jgi:hypothetical protein
MPNGRRVSNREGTGEKAKRERRRRRGTYLGGGDRTIRTNKLKRKPSLRKEGTRVKERNEMRKDDDGRRGES